MSLPDKWNRWVAVIACLAAGSLPADGWQAPKSRLDEPLKGDAIRVAMVQPAPPAVLKTGEKLEIRFDYSLESADQAVILVHPTTRNKYTPHPVAAFRKGKGQGAGWFMFTSPASIEEVQIRMVDVKAKRTLVQVKYPVKAAWR